jgi:cell division protein FtsB
MTDQQRKRLLIGLLLGIPLGGYALFSSRGVFSRLSLEVEKRQLEETILTMRQQQDSLRTVLKRLESDTLLIEQLARERYGMIKPGEEVFLIDSSHTEQ